MTMIKIKTQIFLDTLRKSLNEKSKSANARGLYSLDLRAYAQHLGMADTEIEKAMKKITADEADKSITIRKSNFAGKFTIG